MIVTEEQAKTKWCPQVRFDGEESTFNRGYQSEDPLNMRNGRTQYICNCIGSACMMWRWNRAPRPYTSRVPRDGWEHVSAEDAPDHDMNEEFWMEPNEQWLARREGWCGLAGRVDYA